MNKITVFVITFIIIFSLTACASRKPGSDTTSNDAQISDITTQIDANAAVDGASVSASTSDTDTSDSSEAAAAASSSADARAENS